MTNIIFRVDKRNYKIGDIIFPQSEFEKALEGEKLRLEIMLNQKRACKIPERGKCLFLFHDLQGALRFYLKYGGNVYGVEAIPPFYHRGDMNKLDNILDLFKYVDDDETDEYKIVGSQEADPFQSKISNESPIAKAIMNKKVGDIVEVESPNGAYKIEITEIK